MQPFPRLLVPHDLSERADNALEVAAQIAGPEGELLVLHVVVPVVPPGNLAAVPLKIPICEIKADAMRHLKRIVAQRVTPRGAKARRARASRCPEKRGSGRAPG